MELVCCRFSPQSPCEMGAGHILPSSASRLPLRAEQSPSHRRRTLGRPEGQRQEQLQAVEQGVLPAPGQLPPLPAPRHKCRFINPGWRKGNGSMGTGQGGVNGCT